MGAYHITYAGVYYPILSYIILYYHILSYIIVYYRILSYLHILPINRPGGPYYVFHIAPGWSKSCPVNELPVTMFAWLH